MGTYGTSILGNDTAADVASEFKDAIAYGKSIEEAENQLIADFCIDDEDDPYELCPFWLGLAAKQVQMGRLSERTKANALRIIDEGIDIAIWQEENPKLVPKRQAALDKLRAEITGPQKVPTKVRKPFIDNIEWEEGDGLAYQLPSGKWTALKVRKVVRDRRHQEALYEVLDLCQVDKPTNSDCLNANVRPSELAKIQIANIYETVEERDAAYQRRGLPIPTEDRFEHTRSLQYRRAIENSGFWMSRLSSRENPPRPLVRVASNLETPPTLDCPGFYPMENWKQLDQLLKREYGLE